METGGPAFPELGNVAYNSEWDNQPGMTLRDYFAAKAMQGELASGESSQKAENIAEWAYSVADAMIKARSAHN
ncbi:hypothetical protein ACREYP_08915 [Enterobacter sp. TMH.L2]